MAGFKGERNPSGSVCSTLLVRDLDCRVGEGREVGGVQYIIPRVGVNSN